MPTTTYEFGALRGVGQVELCVQKDQRVYALFGSNGVGKTKCLEALFQFYLLRNKAFLEHFSSSIPTDINVASKYSGGDVELSHGIINKQIALSSKRYVHALPVVYLGAGQRGHIDDDQRRVGPIGTLKERRKRFFNDLYEGMHDQFHSLGMHSDLQEWFVMLANSASPYQKIDDNRKIEIDTLLQLLNQVDSRYDSEFMEIDGGNRVSLKINGLVTELRHLSTGFTSLLKMLQAIISGYSSFTNELNLANVKGYVFIDEIESHLHVEWQSKIVLLLKKLFPNTTFFIATHAPMVLTQLQEGEAYQLRRDADDGVVRSHLITAPNKQALIDVLREGFGVDVNALKRERMSAESQAAAKQRLLALINDGGAKT